MTGQAKTQLLFGPYSPPNLHKGDRAFCLLRDCDVVITSWSEPPSSGQAVGPSARTAGQDCWSMRGWPAQYGRRCSAWSRQTERGTASDPAGV
jgi:hypothetical protein